LEPDKAKLVFKKQFC